MICGKCQYCVADGCDYKCTSKRIKVSPNEASCKDWRRKKSQSELEREIAIMDEYAAIYNSGMPKWAWI